jgi:hypothetical protein
LIFGDLRRGGIEAVGGVAQEDDAQHGHEIVAGGELRVGAKIVSGRPEVGLELGEIVHESSFEPQFVE